MLMVPKSARAHSIKSRVVPKSAVARERVNSLMEKEAKATDLCRTMRDRIETLHGKFVKGLQSQDGKHVSPKSKKHRESTLLLEK